MSKEVKKTTRTRKKERVIQWGAKTGDLFKKGQQFLMKGYHGSIEYIKTNKILIKIKKIIEKAIEKGENMKSIITREFYINIVVNVNQVRCE